MQSKQEIAADYIRRFPRSATKTLARLAYKEAPELWLSVESCRDVFRYVRGNHGKRTRKFSTMPRPNGKSGNPFSDIPPGMVEIDDFKPYVINDPGRYLILSDIHIPYHDRDALMTALESVKDPRGIILNGDICDHFALSYWEKDPRERDFPHEIAVTKKILGLMRAAFPKARMVYKLGNHEERLERYMQLKAPELLGIEALEFQNLFDTDSFHTEVVKDKRPIKLGKLNVIHGHEYRFSISNPVNPARGLFLRSKALALCGHFHQSSHHSENTLDDKQMVCWSTGCLSDLHPRWMVLNKWNLGFATVDIDEKGAFTVENRRIIEGKIY